MESMKHRRLIYALSFILFTTALAILFGIRWSKIWFNEVAFGDVVSLFCLPLTGTTSNITRSVIKNIALPIFVILCTVLSLELEEHHLISREEARGHSTTVKRFRLLDRIVPIAVGLIFTGTLFYANSALGITSFIEHEGNKTSLYDSYYVSPKSVSLAFPAKKRNLIYLYSESMESTFMSKKFGGQKDVSLIPGLTKIAQENTTFTSDGKLQGFTCLPTVDFTMGSIVAQTAGIGVINTDKGNDHAYVAGAYTLGDILHKEGYEQNLLIGSNGDFEARKNYYEYHGGAEVLDYGYAIEKKWIPADYKVWWGYEDRKLFAFAKKDLLRLSASDKPFSLTLLTADTHAPGGYVCPLCKTTYPNQYDNVVACSDRQISEFIAWAQEQKFYANTTIVICGDHTSMDESVVNESNATPIQDKVRRVYSTIINPDLSAEALKTAPYNNRSFSAFDLFPTTLTALGANVEGHRLGLGTDLFSGAPTLLEKFGTARLTEELDKDSDFYEHTLFDPRKP